MSGEEWRNPHLAHNNAEMIRSHANKTTGLESIKVPYISEILLLSCAYNVDFFIEPIFA